MTVKIKTWNQRQWTQPGIEVYHKTGDYAELNCLIPTRDNRQLRRAPAWSAQVRTDTNALATIKGAFFDHTNTRYVLIGSNGSSQLSCAYLSSSWSLSATTVLSTATTGLGGLSMRNAAWWGGYLWVIGADQKVYRGTSYTSALSVFDSSVNHRILAHIGDRMWVFKNTGLIQCINSANNAFYTYLSNVVDFDVRYMAPYRGYLLAISRAEDGHFQILRVPNQYAEAFHELASIPRGGVHPDHGCLYTVHNDHIFFSPGYHLNADGQVTLDILAFNGAFVEHVTTITHSPNTGGSGVPDSAGLLVWRGHLVNYALEGTAQIFKIITAGKTIDFAPLTATVTAIHPIATALGGELITTAKATNEGVHHLGASALADGYYVSPRLDFDHPGETKRLERITVTLSDAATDFKIVAKYRTNDTAGWTTATTGNNTRRTSIGSLDVDFYTLQLRIDLDDDTGNDEDIRITGISVIYTVRQ